MFRWTVALVITFFTATAAWAEMASIAGERVNMRSGPGTRYPVQWELARGFPMKILEKHGNWMRIRDFEGDTGWVFRKFTDKRPTVIVTKKLVNIRKGPGTKHEIAGTAVYGAVLGLLEKGRGWVKVQHGDLVGWVKKTLVWGW